MLSPDLFVWDLGPVCAFLAPDVFALLRACVEEDLFMCEMAFFCCGVAFSFWETLDRVTAARSWRTHTHTHTLKMFEDTSVCAWGGCLGDSESLWWSLKTDIVSVSNIYCSIWMALKGLGHLSDVCFVFSDFAGNIKLSNIGSNTIFIRPLNDEIVSLD